jgi:hypothetical protein
MKLRGVTVVLLALLNALLLGIVCWQTYMLRQYVAADGAAVVNPSGAGNATSRSSRPLEHASADNPPLSSPALDASPLGSGALLPQNSPARFDGGRPILDWREVESEDYQAYIANLRRIGVPEQTVSDIVTADVLQGYAARRAAIVAERYNDFAFWKSDPTETIARATMEERRRAVDAEMNDALREVLGPDSVAPPISREWKVAELNQQLAFLSPEKRQQVRALLLEFGEVEQQVRQLASKMNLTEDLDQRRRILDDYNEKKAMLGEMLTPAEYELVQLNTSFTAENLRRAMVNFHPTEEEFRMIFHEWQAYDELLATVRATGQRDPGDLRKPLETRIREFLGEERASEYWRTWWK